MNAFGYTRVSGRSQVEGDGPDRQRDTITRFCQGWTFGVPTFYNEEAVSGTVEAMDRPAFVAMLAAIERLREIAPTAEVCIVVERLDRLARDLIISELLLSECSKLKIPVYAADQGILADQASAGSDPTRKVIRQIMGAISEWEKSVIVLKLRAARNRIRVREGRCEGAKPYGQTQWEVRMKERMRAYHESGMSYAEIADTMNADGCRNRKRKDWTRGSVYQAVTGRGLKKN